MKEPLVTRLRCPACGAACDGSGTVGARGEVVEGAVGCRGCGATYPIRDRIPRFAGEDNYASSFGFQWNTHARTQLDDHTGNDASRARFFGVTSWPEDLRGERLLEAGSGAGRFTAIAATTGAEVFSFDYSTAVDANFRANGAHEQVHLLQADIYRIPFERASFDKVLCLGVLQHCPDPAAAFRNLATFVAPGGEIVVDVYRRGVRSYVHPKYLLRPVTTRMARDQLYRAVAAIVPVLLPLKRWLTNQVPFGRFPAYAIPVAYQREWQQLGDRVSAELLVELSVLDTFDWYSPAFDHPQTRRSVRRWFAEAGLTHIDVRYGPNGIVGRGRAPAHDRA